MMDAKTLSMLQNQQNLQNAKRSGKTGTRLLDDAENNVGNATELAPEILPAGMLFTVNKQPAPPRLLNLTAESKAGQSVTVVMTAARKGDTSGNAGPVTGIIEFGNGTQNTAIEFDIPIGPYTGTFQGVTPGTQPQDSGTVIQVPTGIIRARSRYDDAYVTPELGGYAFGGPGSAAFPLPAGAGPFAPVYRPHNLPPAPLQIKAFANYFGRHHSKLYKTLYLYTGSATSPVVFAEGVAPCFYSIPPFAKSIQIIRLPNTSSMDLVLSDQIANEPYTITTGPSPVIEITGNQNTFSLKSTGNADTVALVKVVFEIGF